MRIGIFGDMLLGDQPLLCGFGICSRCSLRYQRVFEGLSDLAGRYEFLIGNFEGVLVDKIGRVGPDRIGDVFVVSENV